jgi:lysophospholipid acyltransferase (LPLAT)-like uncharacterized protein
VAVAGWLGASLIRLLGATWRIRTAGPDPFMRSGPVVAGLWHTGLLVAAYRWRGLAIAIPVSRSRDGDLIDAVLGHLGYAESPRGSSSRGASSLLRQLIRGVRSGQPVAVLPDGPRGPAREAKPGVLALARATGAALIPVGVAAKPCISFGSWDRTILPLPFAQVRCRYGEALRVPSESNEAELEAARKHFQAELDSTTRQAARDLAGPGSA